MSSTREVRRHALPRFLAWGAAAAALAVFLVWWLSAGHTLYLSLTAAVPGSMTLVYLIELATGLRFGEWSHRWDELTPAKRFLLGVAIALGSIVFLSVTIPLAMIAFGVIR